MPADFAAPSAVALDPARGPASPEAAIFPLKPRPDWRPWLGGLLSLGMLAVVIGQLARAPSESLARVLGFSPAVWAVFSLLYLAQPLSELAIFGRLWRLPASAFGVLVRKGIINEIVFGYGGEVYFYLWARRKTGLANAPFGAIKDVNIISSLGGNLLTLVMLGISAVELKHVDLIRFLGPMLWSGAGVVALSLVILVFAKRVFCLRRDDLVFVALVSAARLGATTLMTLLLWRLALPEVALGVWLALMTVRLLVARLPFLTNKDLVFANLVFVMVGAHSPVALLLATLAVATLGAHLGLIALLGARDLLRAARKP